MKRKIIALTATAGIAALGLLLAYLFSHGLQIRCLFNLLTGLQCPGCGNTRATLALLRLDFAAMFGYNLLYPVQMLYILRIYIVCVGNYIRDGHLAYHLKPDWIDILCLILIVVWTVIRNCWSL